MIDMQYIYTDIHDIYVIYIAYILHYFLNIYSVSIYSFKKQSHHTTSISFSGQSRANKNSEKILSI